MFCRKCGAEMSENAKFCPKCGNAREEHVQEKRVIEDNNIRIQLKPKFNVLYKLIKNIGYAFVYVFFICLCFTNLYKLWIVFPSTIVTTIAIIAIYIIIKMVFEKIQYDDIEYNFYATKVEYKDGFLNKEEKELKYKFIREITMTRNLLERFCGIGTIRIYTNASSNMYNRNKHNSMKGKNGIVIHCINNVEEQYKAIKQIIDEGTTEN